MKKVATMVRGCESYLDEQSPVRDRALAYYAGKVPDLPVEEGRSSATSKDLRSVTKKLMPSIMRTLLSNDRIVEYEPVGEGDEESADQATDYVNHVVVPESGAEQGIHDAVFDALHLKTGILKWSAYTRRKSEVHQFTDLSDDEVVGLFDDPDNEILDHEKVEEAAPEVLALDPNARRHSFTLRRTQERVEIKLEAVPRGSFLIHPGADSIEDAPIVGERLEVTRSDLVAMGYDRNAVDRLRSESERADDEARMGDDYTDEAVETARAMEEVRVYEVYVRLDRDDDGIAEMYRIFFGEEGGESEDGHVVLDVEPVAEAPYSSVVAERDAHQFEGHSVFEDIEDVQRIKTALLRGVLDSVYWQNNPQPAVDLAQVENPEAVFKPEFASPVLLKSGGDASRALQWMQPPFVGKDAFAMLPYFDDIAKDRTGITDASGGIDPEAFQNMTATSAQLMSEAGIAQAEMIIRSLSVGIRKAFRGILRLVIAHHDQERTIRIRGKWIDYNPAHWNVDMDCTVNVGLGAGSRERDMNVLQVILSLQKELLGSLGPDNPYVKPDQLYNVLAKITETAGFPSAEPYFTKPDPQEIAAKLQAQQGQPDPATVKIEAQMQLEQAKAQARQQVEEAQMQADLRVKAAERQKDLEIASLKAQVDVMKHQASLDLDALKAGLPAPQMPAIGGMNV